MILDHESDMPLYMQIYLNIKDDILSGRLRKNQKLSSKRLAADELGTSINTVATAYSQLLSEGYIYSKLKSGYFVSDIGELRKLSEPGIITHENHLQPQDTDMIDFSPYNMSPDMFPATVWQKMIREAVLSVYGNHSARMPNKGLPELRELICGYLRDSRSYICSPHNMILAPGTDYLLRILCDILPERTVYGMGNPVYGKAHSIFSIYGSRVRLFDASANGFSTSDLHREGITLLYLNPSHQFPLGFSIPIADRVRLLNWAASQKAYIIEDDYDSEYRYDTKPLPSMAGIDAGKRTIYMGTFTRLISPSLRMSYMVLPDSLMDSYESKYGFMACNISRLEQETMCSFIKSGHFERHINRARNGYRKKRSVLLHDIKEMLPECSIYGDRAGHHILVSHSRLKEKELVAKAAGSSVKVYPLSDYYIYGTPDRDCVIIGYGGLSEERISEGIQRLSEAWK